MSPHPSAASLRARAARLSRRHGPDHPETRAAWRDALGEQFAAYADEISSRVPRFTPDQLARIGAVLDAGSDTAAAESTRGGRKRVAA